MRQTRVLIVAAVLCPMEAAIAQPANPPGPTGGPGKAPTGAAVPAGPSPASFKRVQVAGGGAPLVTGRELRVWLPPGYADRANAGRAYPVLYLMDGQNIFEQAPGTPAEWRADETAAELIAAGTMEPFIIVGVPHSERWRMAEYCPLSGVQGVPACGEAFVDWMLTEVKPRVERAFRVKPGPEGSAIGGASMGGLISLYAATRHPDVFGSVLIESPSLVLGQRDTVKELLADAKGWPARVYIGIGDHEVTQGENAADVNTKLVEAVRAVDAAAGTAAVQHLLVVEPGATHDEMAWARRLGPALRFLYTPEKK